jgi:hypothetical protein
MFGGSLAVYLTTNASMVTARSGEAKKASPELNKKKPSSRMPMYYIYYYVSPHPCPQSLT